MKAQRVKHPREFRRWLLRHPARRLLVFSAVWDINRTQKQGHRQTDHSHAGHRRQLNTNTTWGVFPKPHPWA